MKIIFNLMNRFKIKEPKKTLGRWNIDYCDKKLNNKIDLSNEDHCGPCGQYILNKSTVEVEGKKNFSNGYKISLTDYYKNSKK